VFDLRYHVASLAAVFLALVLGILVGAAISDPGLADSAENQTLRDQIARLQERLDVAADRGREEDAAQAFVAAAYGAVMEERLRDRAVAVIFVGGVDEGIRSAVTNAIDDAGGTLLRLRAVRVPGADDVPDAVASPAEMGSVLAQEFVSGGETPVWDEIADTLVEERRGAILDPADGVVVVVRATETSADPSGDEFIRGLLEGVQGSIPVVAVESTRTEPSAVDLYEDADMSIVDNVDAAVGRVSLAVLLAGGQPGHYGVGDGRDALVPPIQPVEPVPAEPGG
jgi:6,7-dimethyl-8-ribityllumazine synthase